MLNPYDLLSDDEGYYFTTEIGITYKVVFDNLNAVFDDYPTLQGRVFSYSFYPTNDSAKFDIRVKHTIVHSINLFFETHTNLIVFVCDSTDARELCRKKLFDKWFKDFNGDGLLEKFDGCVSGDSI